MNSGHDAYLRHQMLTQRLSNHPPDPGEGNADCRRGHELSCARVCVGWTLGQGYCSVVKDSALVPTNSVNVWRWVPDTISEL